MRNATRPAMLSAPTSAITPPMMIPIPGRLELVPAPPEVPSELAVPVGWAPEVPDPVPVFAVG